jgi:hypothetical protein
VASSPASRSRCRLRRWPSLDRLGAGSPAAKPVDRSKPGCITEGDTFEEAIANAREAITGFRKALHKLGEPIPHEDPGLVVVTVEVEAPVAKAVA